MNTRRSFLKGFLATAAIVATGSLARVAEDVFSYVPKIDLSGINYTLEAESGRIARSIYERMMKPSPWLKVIKKEEFPSGLGVTLVTQV